MDGNTLDDLSPDELKTFISRLHNLHFSVKGGRLRLRGGTKNPISDWEKEEWRDLIKQLREMLPEDEVEGE